jgi:hypothetical protein
VSRQLAKTRKAVREDVERRLAADHGFGRREIDECFASVVDDAGNLDLAEWLRDASRAEASGEGGRKKSELDRSKGETAAEGADKKAAEGADKKAAEGADKKAAEGADKADKAEGKLS